MRFKQNKIECVFLDFLTIYQVKYVIILSHVINEICFQNLKKNTSIELYKKNVYYI